MRRQLGETKALYITDERRGRYKSLACPYTGDVCSLSEPALTIIRTRASENPYRILFSKRGVEQFSDDLQAIGSDEATEQVAVLSFDEGSGNGRVCLHCGDQLRESVVCELRPTLHDDRHREQEYAVLCHRSCAAELATDVEQFWSHLGLFLTE